MALTGLHSRGDARLIWITDIKPDGLAETIAPLFDQAIEGVRAKHS